jgi:hypothetical protein
MDDLGFVALAANRMEADIMIATLESEGIAATWRPVVPTVGLRGGSVGPIEILVPRENQERARELLQVDVA